MPPWIGEIAPILMIGAVAVLAAAHAIVSLCTFEHDLHDVRAQALRLHEQIERRRAMLLDDSEVEDLGQMPDAQTAKAA